MNQIKRLIKLRVSFKTAVLMVTSQIVVALLAGLALYHAVQVETVRSTVVDRNESLQVVQLYDSGGHSCSGFRVGPKTVVTAAHCFSGSDPAKVSVLFSPLNTPTEVSSGPICQAVKIDAPLDLDTQTPEYLDDFALVTLDECAYFSEQPLSYYTLATYTPGEELGGLNYPGDLPASTLVRTEGHEVSNWVNIFLNKPEGFLRTNLAAYLGSSGGVVFSADQPNTAVGVTVRTGGDNSTWVLALNQQRLDLLKEWIALRDPQSKNAAFTP